jgi:hypothetical protein
MKKRNSEAICMTCLYWIPANDANDATNEIDGQCRRYPPTPQDWNVDMKEGDLQGFVPYISWPDTTYDDTCGEHPDFFKKIQK